MIEGNLAKRIYTVLQIQGVCRVVVNQENNEKNPALRTWRSMTLGTYVVVCRSDD